MSACTSRPRLGRFGWPGRGRRVGGLIAVPATRRQHPGECPGWPVPAGWRNEGLRDRRCRRRHGLRPWPASNGCRGDVMMGMLVVGASGARNPGRAPSSGGAPAGWSWAAVVAGTGSPSASVRTRAGIVLSRTVPGSASSLPASASAGTRPASTRLASRGWPQRGWAQSANRPLRARPQRGWAQSANRPLRARPQRGWAQSASWLPPGLLEPARFRRGSSPPGSPEAGRLQPGWPESGRLR